jgi:drug/metabolite transporter (DMT)-like permease
MFSYILFPILVTFFGSTNDLFSKILINNGFLNNEIIFIRGFFSLIFILIFLRYHLKKNNIYSFVKNSTINPLYFLRFVITIIAFYFYNKCFLSQHWSLVSINLMNYIIPFTTIMFYFIFFSEKIGKKEIFIFIIIISSIILESSTYTNLKDFTISLLFFSLGEVVIKYIGGKNNNQSSFDNFLGMSLNFALFSVLFTCFSIKSVVLKVCFFKNPISVLTSIGLGAGDILSQYFLFFTLKSNQSKIFIFRYTGLVIAFMYDTFIFHEKNQFPYTTIIIIILTFSNFVYEYYIKKSDNNMIEKKDNNGK